VETRWRAWRIAGATGATAKPVDVADESEFGDECDAYTELK
jgi:hypothetical protein